MAHNITERDLQVGLENAWHGLTKIVDSIDIDNNWLSEWDIQSEPIYMKNGTELDHKILVASDDGLPIGKPYGTSYTPITNKQFLDLVRDALDNVKGAKIETVGSVRGKGRVFCTLSIKDHSSYKIKGREFKDYLNFGNSHDQSSSLWVNNTNTCTVCDNTFSYNFHSSGLGVGSKVIHKGDINIKLLNLKKLVENYLIGQEDFIEKFEKLCTLKVSEKRARDIFTGFLRRNDSNKNDSELSVRTLNKTNTLVNLFNSGRGNRGETFADLFSAVTDYYTHSSTRGMGQNRVSQYFSSEFGLGRSNKESFWNIINSPERLESTTLYGEKLNNNYAITNN